MSAKLPGFLPYEVDAIVKFGGSLLSDDRLIRLAVSGIEAANRAGKRILIVPGGGPTDKTIEALDRRAPLAPATHHQACARAQDQTGLIIADPAYSASLRTCETLEEARRILADNLIPVLLPSRLILAVDPFERSWEITSDAMALWFAWLISAPLAVILTNVDGIFPPGAPRDSSAPVPEIRASDLIHWGPTSVDICTPHFARAKGIAVWVLHGGHPERLLSALNGQVPIGTKILPA